jgi:hypothetical protein
VEENMSKVAKALLAAGYVPVKHVKFAVRK